jgi:rod shape-determining protein MreB and related proteins
MSLVQMLGHFTRGVGVDLGTANTLVYVQGEGIVVREPSVIACRTGHKEILAVGNEAKMMIGRTPAEIVATRPMRSGVIADFDTTTSMLSYFIRKGTHMRRLQRPRVMVGIPSGATIVEKRAVIGAGEQAGGRMTYLIEQPLAAAVGAGLEISEPIGRMIVDVGGGTTEVAVIALGNIVTVRSLRVAGDNMDEAVIQYARKVHNLLIGERMAEDVKIRVGSVYPRKDDETVMMRGRDLVSGLPRSLRVSGAEIRSAIMDAVTAIVNTVKMTLEQTPPELAADIMKEGIHLTGGGSLLRGFDLLLREETGVPVARVADPLDSVALGTGKALGAIESMKRVLITRDLV